MKIRAVAAVVLLVVLAGCAAAGQTRLGPFQVPQMEFGPYTVGTLPAYTLWLGYATIVTDATNSTDCSTGGGSIPVLCYSDAGVGWVPIAGFGGGGSVSSCSNLTPLFTCGVTGSNMAFAFINAPPGTLFGNLAAVYANPGYNVIPSCAGDGTHALTYPSTSIQCTSISAAPGGPAGGDLNGTFPNPTVVNLSHTTNSSLANSGLVNPSTTVNGQVCTLGSSCTITAGGVVVSGTAAMGTSSISSGTCASVVTVTATGATTSGVGSHILATASADPTGVTGYAPSANGSLYIQAYPTSGHVNFKVCNNTSASITPGALTLNWDVF